MIEKIAYTPLRSAPRISLLITAIGVSFFLEYMAELILGSGAKVIPAYYTNQTFRIGSVPRNGSFISDCCLYAAHRCAGSKQIRTFPSERGLHRQSTG